MAVTASSTPQAAFASTRMRPPAPSAARTASTRAQSSAIPLRGSATFTLAVVQPPEAATRAAASAGPTTGIVTLTGTRARRGAGRTAVAASMPARSQAADSAGP